MDEVLFRSGQKIENLQVHAGIITTKAKDVLVLYSQAGKAFILRIWDSAPVLQIRDNWTETIAKLSVITEASKAKILNVADVKALYQALLNVFSKKWTKRDMYFGCSGLMIGIVIGLAIGFSIKKREQVVRYMRAVQCFNYFGIESVTVVEDALAPHDCGNNDILVNVKAASVNVIDVEITCGYGKTLREILVATQKQMKQPVILGRECAGVIVDIGKKVKRLDIGDEVWLTVPFWAQGALCQTVLVSEKRVSKKPKTVEFEGASSLPYAGSWALAALNKAGIDEITALDKKILVQGGCTPVGCVLVQLLSNWNASVTATCYKRAVPVARALGASDIIVLIEYPVINDSRQATDGKDASQDNLILQLENKGQVFDFIFITSKDSVQEKDLIKFVSHDGLVLSTLPPVLVSDSFGLFTKPFLKWYIFMRFLLQKLIGLPQINFDETHLCYATLNALTEYVESGQLKTVVDKIYQPHDVEMALHHIQSTQAIGSTIITFR